MEHVIRDKRSHAEYWISQLIICLGSMSSAGIDTTPTVSTGRINSGNPRRWDSRKEKKKSELRTGRVAMETDL